MNPATSTRARRPGVDWFLVAILLGLGALLVAGGIAVVLARQPAPTLPADSPGSTVQQFYLALAQQDYDKAYSLLSSSLQNKTTRADFIQYNVGRFSSQ